MANCGLCGNHLGLREKKYAVGGETYCYACMTCTTCRSPGRGDQRFVLAKGTVLCLTCNQKRLQGVREGMISEILANSLPNPFGTRFILESDERVKSWYNGWRFFSSERGIDSKSEGSFILTNLRAVYIQEKFTPAPNSSGFIDGSFELNLESITGATPSSGGPNSLVIYSGRAPFNIFLGATRSSSYPIDVLIVALLRLRFDRIAEIKKSKENEKIQIVTDFSWLRDYMEKGGIMIKTYKCPRCSGAIDIPANGKTGKCGFCGTTFYAEDVFKKVKDLIE